MYYITIVVQYFESKREIPIFRYSIITSCNINVFLKFRDLFRRIGMRTRGWRLSFPPPPTLIELIIPISVRLCLSLSEVYFS